MRDDHNTDATSLKQRYSSWSDANTGLFSTHSDDPQPFRTAPAPATFHSPHILSQFGPDPLLAITPEKNLGLASLQKTRAYAENRPASPKSRQRVRFAPGTRTSPSEKNVSSDSVERGADLSSGKGDFGVKGHDDSDSQPRSFSFVSQKLYEPGRYSDGDSKLSVEESPGASALVSSASAPKNSVKSTGKSAAYTCVPLGQASGGSVDTSSIDVKAKVIRHTPSSSYPSTVTDDIISASDSDVTQNPPRVKLTKHSSATKTSTSTRSRSPARPSSRSPGRGRSSRPVSPGVSSRSPSRSPGRLTPTESVDYSTLLEDDDPTPPVMVIREAPRQPELGGYVFPFEEKVYDSSENPLARPEFNSTLKISEELKCVKGKRPDTWQAVNQRLKSSNQKRTEIQEKASSKVNVQRQSGLYADLVDLNTPLDDFYQDVEREITQRAPSSKPAPSRVPIGKEPDLMEFFSPALQPELPDLTLTGVAPVSDGLTTANPALALDLYRHNRAWNGMTDS